MTLLELRDLATVDDALARIAAAEPVDYTPRIHFIEGAGAVCVYADDIAYRDLPRLDANGPRHRLYLRDDTWDYIRD